MKHLQQDEAARFRAQAFKESKSLSAWLRDAGKAVFEMRQEKPRLNTSGELKKFFHECNRREQGAEPGWEEIAEDVSGWLDQVSEKTAVS